MARQGKSRPMSKPERPGRHVWTDASLVDREVVVFDDTGDALNIRLPGGIEVCDEGAFDVVMRAELGDDLRPEIRELSVWRRPGGPPITSGALRSIPFGEYLRHMCETEPVGLRLKRRGDALVSKDRSHVIALADLGMTVPRRRAKPADRDELLRNIAAVHRMAGAGERTKAVAKHFGYSVASAKRLVGEARDAGYLEHSARSARASLPAEEA